MKLIRPQEKGKKADAFWWTKEHIPRYGGTHPQDIGDNTLGRNWDKRQTDKSRCQESLSKIEVRGSQILGGPGTSTQWQTDRWVEYISLSCHKKPEYTAKCHENSRLASSSSHISNQGLHTSFFLANCMPRQPNCPILQLKVNISSTLWLFSAPWPWLESPAWMQTSGQQRLRCDNQAPGIFMHEAHLAPELWEGGICPTHKQELHPSLSKWEALLHGFCDLIHLPSMLSFKGKQ